MQEVLVLIVPFIFGAVIGSFLNVCIYRLPLGLSVVSPGSRCSGCGKPVAFYDNIPILSFLVLRGRCRACGERFSAEYPAVEAFTGIIYAALFSRFGPGLEFLIYAVFLSALVVITFIDLRHQIIPDVISLPGIPAGVLASFILPEPGLWGSIIGVIAGGGILLSIAYGYYFLAKREGMGGGDVKLLAMIGAFLGWKAVILTLLVGSFAGAAVGAVLIALAGKTGRHAIPFGPFLALGAAVYVFFGEAILDWYLMRPGIGY